MKRAVQATGPIPFRAPTATYTIRFEKRPRSRRVTPPATHAGRIPRVTRLLALAHKIDGMIRAGEIKDWADAARLVGVTRARMTQIANLLLLSPIIQERLLTLQPTIAGRRQPTEHALRILCSTESWRGQACLHETTLLPASRVRWDRG